MLNGGTTWCSSRGYATSATRGVLADDLLDRFDRRRERPPWARVGTQVLVIRTETPLLVSVSGTSDSMPVVRCCADP